MAGDNGTQKTVIREAIVTKAAKELIKSPSGSRIYSEAAAKAVSDFVNALEEKVKNSTRQA